MAQPMCESISTIFSMEEDSSRIEVTRFSTPSTTPSEVQTPIAVEPSYYELGLRGTVTLIASIAYSTWNNRLLVRHLCLEMYVGYPSGENY